MTQADVQQRITDLQQAEKVRQATLKRLTKKSRLRRVVSEHLAAIHTELRLARFKLEFRDLLG